MSRAEAAAAALLDLTDDQVEDIEVKLLLEGVHLRYGYDFRNYAMPSVRRSLQAVMAREGTRTVSAFQDRVLHDPACMHRFLAAVAINVTTMFRETELIHAIRDEVVPMLKTYPTARIWVAGCATGEEVYSLAVVLKEEDVLRRCSIYATDMNENMLAIGRLGAYPVDRFRRYTEAYRAAGGRATLWDHCTVGGTIVRFDHELMSRITWARHNLVTDGSFNDFHLILCSNVLIYFGRELRERAHRLFYDSLVRGGHLGLGKRESLLNCPDAEHYEQVRSGANLFRKMRW